MVKLPPRLGVIVALLPPGLAVADVGSDHGLLPLYLHQTGRARRVVATEKGSGPFRRLEEALAAAGAGEEIVCRQGDGLEVLAPGEVEAVVVAGMGGETILRILARRAEVAREVLLLLVPNTAWGQVRRWLLGHDFYLLQEEMVQEGKHFYPIIVTAAAESRWAVPFPPEYPSPVTNIAEILTSCPLFDACAGDDFSREVLQEVILEAGPHLLRRRHPVLLAYAQQRVAGLAAILARVPVTLRRRELEQRYKAWERVVSCLSPCR